MEFLTPKPPLDSKLLKTSAGSVVPFLAITAIALFLSITTGQNLLMQLKASEEFFGYDNTKVENTGQRKQFLYSFSLVNYVDNDFSLLHLLKKQAILPSNPFQFICGNGGFESPIVNNRFVFCDFLYRTYAGRTTDANPLPWL